MIGLQMVARKRKSSPAERTLLAPRGFGKHHPFGERRYREGMSEASPPNDRLKIFVSYSRREIATADKLVAAASGRRLPVTIDRRDLPFGEEWQKELADLIRAADTVVWLVSPTSVKSRWCGWELGEVLRLNKRLIPVVIDVVPPDGLPEIARPHPVAAGGRRLRCEEAPSGAGRGAEHGCAVAERAHAARRPRTPVDRPRDRASALLLRGVALKDAQAWADRKPSAAPPPSDEILELFSPAAGRRDSRQRAAIAAISSSRWSALAWRASPLCRAGSRFASSTSRKSNDSLRSSRAKRAPSSSRS